MAMNIDRPRVEAAHRRGNDRLRQRMSAGMQNTVSSDFDIVFSHQRNIRLTKCSVNATLAIFQLQRIKRPRSARRTGTANRIKFGSLDPRTA